MAVTERARKRERGCGRSVALLCRECCVCLAFHGVTRDVRRDSFNQRWARSSFCRRGIVTLNGVVVSDTYLVHGMVVVMTTVFSIVRIPFL